MFDKNDLELILQEMLEYEATGMLLESVTVAGGNYMTRRASAEHAMWVKLLGSSEKVYVKHYKNTGYYGDYVEDKDITVLLPMSRYLAFESAPNNVLRATHITVII